MPMTQEGMPPHIEVVGADGHRRIALGADRLTIGADDSNDLTIADDPTISRLHAALERYGAGWCVRDLGSHNGTFVNGQRILGERALHPDDELRIGASRLVFRSELPEPGRPATATAESAPELTRRERDVLLALCRPVLSADVFTEPASIREIAESLVVTEAAVKQHLLRLYDKFGIRDPAERRRVKLANAAVRRGAVALADLKT